MSLTAVPTPIPPLQQLLAPRKRTSSFSFPNPSLSPNPRPTKAPRTSISTGMGALRRTESYIVLPVVDNHSAPSTSTTPASSCKQESSSSPLTLPYHRTLRFYKEQRDRRKALLNRTLEPITIRTRLEVTLSQPPNRVYNPQSKVTPRVAASPSNYASTPRSCAKPRSCPTPPTIPTSARVSSPLAPTRTPLPGRPVFPRSRPEPDLYRKAITTRMKSSAEGQKILHMGPRLAMSIMTATRELERIVAAQDEREKGNSTDVAMGDATTPTAPVITTSTWFVVNGEDWEMVDAA